MYTSHRVIIEPDQIGEDFECAYDTHNFRDAEGMKLITYLFDGDKKWLRKFIRNVDVAFELVHPNKQEILLKFVKMKITGDASSKLIVRDLTHTWGLVKRILEQNYAVRARCIIMHAECLVLERRRENCRFLGSRIDEIQTIKGSS